MPNTQLDTMVRRSIRRTEWTRALILGVMAAACLLTAAYVSLAAGLWLAILAFSVAVMMLRFTAKRRQQPIAEELTIPELEKAFERMHYTLEGSLPEQEITALYPEGCEVECADRIDGNWHGSPFTFANVVIYGEMRRPLFHGQWLIVRTGWPDCVRVAIREQDGTPDDCGSDAQGIILHDDELRARYRVESDRMTDAAVLLTEERLRGLLMSAEGIRLMVEHGVLHLAMPSDVDFFTLQGTESTADEVAEATRHDISVICSWLDSILQVEFR